MDKQQLQERIAAITNEMVQTKANYAKLEGHLGEAQHWLNDLIMKDAHQDLNAQGEQNGEANQQGESEVASEQVCGAEGAEVPNPGQEPCVEC